jgi:hypothetical protein
VGILEEIDALELSDDVKERLKAEHNREIDPLKADRARLARDSKRDKVEDEIKSLGVLFSDDEGNVVPEAVSLLKFTRRVLLSDTDADPAQEPEAILLADHELGLSGDQATGAHAQEGITAAGAVRKFVELLPTAEKDGKMRLLLSDVALSADDHGREAGSGATEEESDSTKRAEHLAGAIGADVPKRTRSRYSGGRPAAKTGGGS